MTMNTPFLCQTNHTHTYIFAHDWGNKKNESEKQELGIVRKTGLLHKVELLKEISTLKVKVSFNKKSLK